MPHKAKRYCRYKGCSNLVQNMSGYCEEHKNEMTRYYDKFVRSPEHNKRYGYRWRKIRMRFLKINPLCEQCKSAGKYTLAVEVHHKKPLSEGGTNDENNLMSLCRSCHAKIHSHSRK